jgi:predicted 3-demethylubiquinone-9 3-methyltransferase (glyoxalase superfamily)
MSRIAPCLWFDGDAEAAATFYTALFPDSKIESVSRWWPNGRFPQGTALLVEFTLFGQRFQALNGGPEAPPNDCVSLSIDCEDAAEVDRYWDALTADGGEEGRCGWLKDRFGFAWQIVPRGMGELIGSPDPGRAARAMEAMMGMKKLDIAAMRTAADG